MPDKHREHVRPCLPATPTGPFGLVSAGRGNFFISTEDRKGRKERTGQANLIRFKQGLCYLCGLLFKFRQEQCRCQVIPGKLPEMSGTVYRLHRQTPLVWSVLGGATSLFLQKIAKDAKKEQAKPI